MGALSDDVAPLFPVAGASGPADVPGAFMMANGRGYAPCCGAKVQSAMSGKFGILI
jgi:hypothetical protein